MKKNATSQQPTANSQQLTANSQQLIANNSHQNNPKQIAYGEISISY
jgi:hypothetical protein